MTAYYRPLLQSGPARPAEARTLAGGWTWFTQAEVLHRGHPAHVLPVSDLPVDALERLTTARPVLAGLDFKRPAVMGILNVTPDSFSDGGLHATVSSAVAGARAMAGADILDVGGESTRPGAAAVPVEEEIARTAPVISALRQSGVAVPISVDTRKAPTAAAALSAGANLVNDVSGFLYDPTLADLCASSGVPVCVMHAQGDPTTMQNNPMYDDVLLDVYDFLAERITALIAAGIPRGHIIVDPGIGFGKSLPHNLALLSRLSLFHSLGVPVLLGVSRKRFIGTIGQADAAQERMPGSIAVALAALHQGIQVLRVHDVPETCQAIALWRAVVAGEWHG